ncbi:unnamed protein product [Parascedosporium putredinis]|uniref:Cation-transporting P-type ATPase N-terminal domain-containing protein n=1 Tax=Parascedosporium putredinis TaxID=1442378 RepID=A0A9P1H138_9PEZI|nr:unnamed protein product [Parascedosporium putredinis]CAI7992393.1 unnamed protein product [Parascedosporium putredinis]
MSQDPQAKLPDPEAPAAARIIFSKAERPTPICLEGLACKWEHSPAASVPFTGVQIEYRTLSIHVSESRRIEQETDPKLDSGKKREEYFAALTYHELQVEQVCQLFNVSLDQGLSDNGASIRLARDGKNTLPRAKTNYIKSILKYLFGGFCSVLWIGAIIFFFVGSP